MADISVRERALMQSTGSLLEHLKRCEDCRVCGIAWCDDLSSLLAVLRVDRGMAPVSTGSDESADPEPDAYCTTCDAGLFSADDFHTVNDDEAELHEVDPGEYCEDHCPLCSDGEATSHG